jgi:hypothetical protein
MNTLKQTGQVTAMLFPAQSSFGQFGFISLRGIRSSPNFGFNGYLPGSHHSQDDRLFKFGAPTERIFIWYFFLLAAFSGLG